METVSFGSTACPDTSDKNTNFEIQNLPIFSPSFQPIIITDAPVHTSPSPPTTKHYFTSRAAFPNHRVTFRYRAVDHLIPGRTERIKTFFLYFIYYRGLPDVLFWKMTNSVCVYCRCHSFFMHRSPQAKISGKQAFLESFFEKEKINNDEMAENSTTAQE